MSGILPQARTSVVEPDSAPQLRFSATRDLIPKIGGGLDSYQIKVIALVFMTLDHLAACGFKIPIFATYYWELRRVGRIAAPLFLFILTESMRFTQDKKRFVIRLYFASVAVGLFTAFTNLIFGGIFVVLSPGNIIFTFFYVALYIYAIERGITAYRNRKLFVMGCWFAVIPITLLTYFPQEWMYENAGRVVSTYGLSAKFLIQDITTSFIQSPLTVEYYYVFVILGVVMYFLRNKTAKVAAFTITSAAFYLVARYRVFIYPSAYIGMGIFQYPQYWMILAAPIMLLYNGKPGKPSKLFFYIYYPVHRYIIAVANSIYLTMA